MMCSRAVSRLVLRTDLGFGPKSERAIKIDHVRKTRAASRERRLLRNELAPGLMRDKLQTRPSGIGQCCRDLRTRVGAVS